MKRYISRYDEKYYTNMLKLINSIGGRKLKYNWLITSIEVYPTDKTITDKLDKEYLFLSNDELLDILQKEDFQWIWATFSAIPQNIENKDILQYKLPDRENESISYKSEVYIQHPLADIEIGCFDSSCFQIIFKNKEFMKDFLKYYPNVEKDFDSPEDYFTTWRNRVKTPTFEFSYYKFNSTFSIKNNILYMLKKDNKVYHHKDSLHIYEEDFNYFMDKFPYFDETTLKDGSKGKFNYFGPDNYYNKEQTEYILTKLKEDIQDDNKKIIKFLEKAIEEHNGFYIHGI